MADTCQGTEINIQGLYLYHTCLGPNVNQGTVIDGKLAANNWTVYDGPGTDAKLVARAQGLHIDAGNWHNSFSLVFENGRYSGSTLQVMGIVVERGEWAIVGGTGQFSMATGVIYKRFHVQNSDGNVMELTIKGFCPLVKSSPVTSTQYPVNKIGTWGGNGGSVKDITELPKRLESVTIMSGNAIDSIKFTYIDQAGQKHTVGPWGGSGGYPHTIDLGATEIVKEISGTVGTYQGLTFIASFKLVTDSRTFGPWGVENGTPFRVPVQSGSAIVGFFARSGSLLDAIGVHVTSV